MNYVCVICRENLTTPDEIRTHYCEAIKADQIAVAIGLLELQRRLIAVEESDREVATATVQAIADLQKRIAKLEEKTK